MIIYPWFKELTDNHPELRKVRILDLDDEHSIGDDLSSVFGLEDLEVFEHSVKCNFLRGSFVVNIGEVKCTKLRSIKMRNNNAVNEGFTAADMCQFLEMQTQLRTLHLEGVGLTDEVCLCLC